MVKPKSKTKTFYINPSEDYAIVQSYTDDGLFDGDEYEEWKLILEIGDRSERDYADYEGVTSECD